MPKFFLEYLSAKPRVPLSPDLHLKGCFCFERKLFGPVKIFMKVKHTGLNVENHSFLNKLYKLTTVLYKPTIII